MDKRELLDFLVAHSEKIFSDSGECMTIFFAVKPSGEIAVVPGLWSNEEEKVNILEQIKLMFAIWGVRTYGQVSEVWMKSFKNREDMPEGMRVSDYEDKEERLMVFTIDEEGPLVVHRTIERPFDGPPTLGPVVELDLPMSGRMFELLPVRTAEAVA